LYDVETQAIILTRQLGQMAWQEDALVFQEYLPSFELSEDITPAIASFEEIIQLEGYNLAQTADSLDLRLFWRALANGREDFFHFVHLVDPETGDIVAQHDSMPRNNTYPTSQWANNEIVLDNLRLDVADLPPGEYLLYVGLYRNLGNAFPPLVGVDGAGRPLDDNRFLLGKVVIQ
jgi:hypothetical protein